MKRIVFVTLAGLMLTAAVPAFAQEQSEQDKVICNLAAKNCLSETEKLQKRVKKMQSDMKKGTKTYSAEDVQKLEQKLKEAQEILDKIEGTPVKK
ncbi:MAG: hypothetical protein ED859_10230 [Desulfuromonadales bacterium]|nr:MAG: hypothetical protein ED859_10230 [Desulfuromonadales bacterium]